jgi:hypothetical protein
LAPTAEQDLYDRALERTEIARQKQIDDTLAEFAGRGFSMPQGIMADAVDMINEKQYADSLTRSREIRIKQAELAQANTWKAIESGITLENILIAHHDRIMDRALQAARSVLDIAIAIVQARVALAQGKINLATAQIGLRVDIEKLKIDVYQSMVAAYAKKLDAVLGRARAYVDLYQADTAVYAANVSKGEAEARLAVSQGQIAVENIRANVVSALEASKANLQAFISTAQVNIGAAEAGARVYASYVSAALNSLNTIIQMASTGQTIKSE